MELSFNAGVMLATYRATISCRFQGDNPE